MNWKRFVVFIAIEEADRIRLVKVQNTVGGDRQEQVEAFGAREAFQEISFCG
jgi:hypothetical protein